MKEGGRGNKWTLFVLVIALILAGIFIYFTIRNTPALAPRSGTLTQASNGNPDTCSVSITCSDGAVLTKTCDDSLCNYIAPGRGEPGSVWCGTQPKVKCNYSPQ
mgnify:CR=1 FL=1